MTRYVSGACISENGTITGRAGDQNKKELCVHTLASSGSWSRILRPPRNASIIVKQAYAAAANDHIGYDQYQRTTLFAAAQKVGFELSAVKTDVETDCSALVAVLCNAAGFKVSKDMYTGNERSSLAAVGFKDMPYSEGSLQPGDVLWRKGHTVVYVGTNKSYVATTSKPVVAKLVDLSHHNGNVDLAKVKKAGYHVILKAGEGTSMTDGTFESRAKKCEQLGIPYGAYYYARAKTAAQAKAEANRCLMIVKGRKLSYPIYYDIEEASLGSVASITVPAFCSVIEKAGYWAGVYSGDSYWQAHLIPTPGDRYTKWVARYGVNNGSPSYKPVTKAYDIWQYSSKGKVDGVSGYVDVNNVYKDLPAAIAAKAAQKPSGGSTGAKTAIKYRVRLISSKAWLAEVSGSAGYAGKLGSTIGYIAISGVKRYRVKTARGWLPWVSKYDVTDLNNGCAGDGTPIYAVQVDDVTARYAVHVLGGGWLADMVGTKDTGGSSDTFAGNGKKIDGFRIRRV